MYIKMSELISDDYDDETAILAVFSSCVLLCNLKRKGDGCPWCLSVCLLCSFVRLSLTR